MQTTINSEPKLLPRDYQAESDALDGRLSSERQPVSMMQRLLRAGLRSGALRPWFCEAGQEVYSCLCRIRLLLHLRTVPRNDLGLHFGVASSGHLVPCTRTHGRRLDTHKFLQTGCRSPVDLEIFLAGWNAGAKWCDDNPHVCIPDRESGLYACMEPPARTRD